MASTAAPSLAPTTMAPTSAPKSLLYWNAAVLGRAGAMALAANDDIFSAGGIMGTGNVGGATLVAPSDGPRAVVTRLTPGLDVVWATAFGGSGYGSGAAGVAWDGALHIYVTGFFQGNLTTGALAVSGGGFYLAKLDAATGATVWLRASLTPSDSEGFSVAADASGAVVTGYFQRNLTLSASTTLVGNPRRDLYVAKYDPAGSLLWASGWGASLDDYGNSVALDASGDIYVVGIVSNTVTFGTTTLVASASGDVLVLKLGGADGAVRWARVFLGTTGSSTATDVVLDPSGASAYVTGFFRGQFTCDGVTLLSQGTQDMFLLGLDTASNGTVVWASSWGGKSFDSSYGVARNAGGDRLFLTGTFSKNITIAGTFLEPPPPITEGIVVVAVDAGTGAATGVQAFYSSSSTLETAAILVNSKNETYVSGLYAGNMTWNGTVFTAQGVADAFVGKTIL